MIETQMTQDMELPQNMITCQAKDSIFSRSQFVDTLRGGGIFLMLWGHSIQYLSTEEHDFFSNWVFKYIYSFHMPLLILISGFLFYYSLSKYPPRILLERKTVSLIKPIIVGSILFYFFTTGLRGLLHGNFRLLLDGKWIHSLTDIWFLWTVLACSVTIGLLHFFYNRQFALEIGGFLGLMIVALFPNYQYNIYLYPFFLTGMLANKYKETIKRFYEQKWIKCVCVISFIGMILFFRKEHYIYLSGIWGDRYLPVQYICIDFYRWIIGLAGCVSFIILINYLTKLSIFSLICSYLSILGKYTLQIYILQRFLLEVYVPWGLYFLKKSCLASIYDFIFSYEIFYDSFTFSFSIVYAIGLYQLSKWMERKGYSQLIFGR